MSGYMGGKLAMVSTVVKWLTFARVILVQELCQGDPATPNSHHHCVVEETYQANLLLISKLQEQC